mmetsp:Transcript_32003/g.76501  ORF Transcript_32003/g.76501 Transcript_32003/m.76501 type:complete len:97 (+) Transcript_32003:152-442(+)
MGFTDWKCDTCGQRGHRKSSNPNKCNRGRDKHLDWGSPDMRCCNCVIAAGDREIRCPGCTRRWEIANPSATNAAASTNTVRPSALEVTEDTSFSTL